MKLLGISELRCFDKMDKALFLVFKIGGLLGMGVLVIGSIGAALYDPQQFMKRVPTPISAAAEAFFAVACASLAVVAVLRGFIEADRFSKTTRITINLAITHAFAALLLTSLAIVCGVLAIKDLFRQ